MRVKCLAQEHNTMSPARARTRTARSGGERTNHEAAVPPIRVSESCFKIITVLKFHRSRDTTVTKNVAQL